MARQNLTGVRKHGSFGPQQKKKFLRLLEKSGNLRQSATDIGVSAQAVYLAMKKDKVLAEAVDRARDKASVAIEKEIHRRAIDGVEKDVYFQGEVVGTEVIYSDRLLELLAKANMPEYRAATQQGGGTQVNVNIVTNETKSKLADLLGVTIDQEPVDVN